MDFYCLTPFNKFNNLPMKSISAKSLFALLFFVCLFAGCSNTVPPRDIKEEEGNEQENKRDSFFAKGADISWLPQMEATGYKFYNDQGVQEDCFKILKDHGINSIRLRTFVNPSDDKASGHCSKDETVAMALRARQWGMKVMINFHYSDSWADPAKQRKPKVWEGHDFPTLLNDLYNYTFDVMSALKSAGITPEWV